MIDLRTIFICTIAVELFLVLVMFLYWKTQKTYPGFFKWILGIFSLLIAHILYSFRGTGPDFMTIALANTFVILSVFLKLESLKLYFHASAFRRQVYLLFIPLALVFYFFTEYIDISLIRTIIVSVLAILILSKSVYILLTRCSPEEMLFSKLFAALYTLFVLVMLGRLLEWWIVPVNRDLLTPSFFNDSLMFMDLIISVGTTIVYLLLNAQRMNSELELSRLKAQDFAERYLHAVKSAKACVWDLDLTTGDLFWDESLDELCGSHIESEKQLKNICQSFGIDLDNISDLRNACNVGMGQDYLKTEFNFSPPYSGMRYLLVHATTACDGASPDRLSGLIYDLTSLRKAEHALKESHRKLNLLTDITRHDILNKVHIVRGFGELLTRDLNNQQQEMAAHIVESANLIFDLISFTGQYQNIGMQDPKWQDIAILLDSSEIHASIDGIALTRPESGTLIYADVMLEKLLFNLIENSLRHGGNVDSISLSYEYSGNSLKVIYQDDGVGIPEEDKEQIFERGHGENTGLGLFFCREILEITGLSIRETGIYGEGVRFEIIVPPDYFRVGN
ncbi:Histidine kinase-, DNA gyrase B-, and HSP90-like ATPase [Methanolobus vulcani]|uniref:histidine kinase n=1 Tax=Methanolobus vulcani TaxID=38026 RepID=A0A7Z7AWA2_9EURY|nr:Histidine kinase-, DNA gyrase B-, and HSP90-like ATPase [Methanolobus vulcani]